MQANRSDHCRYPGDGDTVANQDGSRLDIDLSDVAMTYDEISAIVDDVITQEKKQPT